MTIFYIVVFYDHNILQGVRDMRAREKISCIRRIIRAVQTGGEFTIRGHHKNAIFYEGKSGYVEMDIVNKDKSWHNGETLAGESSYIRAFNLINFLVRNIEDELKNNREMFKPVY